MIKKIFLLTILTIVGYASDICLDGTWIDKIDIEKLSISMSGNEPMWEGQINNGSIFSFNELKSKKISLVFSQNNHIIFFETKDKTIFGEISLIGNECIKNEDGNYQTRVVIGNRLYIDEFTFVSYAE